MKEEVIDGKRVWTFGLKEFVGNDPPYPNSLREGNGMEKPEWEIGQRIPIFRLLGLSNFKGQDGGLSTDGKCGNPKINGKNTYRRLFIKRIGYETYLGNGLWALEFDNATEEEFEEYMARNCVNSDDDE